MKVLQSAEGVAVDPADAGSLVDLSGSALRILQALPEPGREEIACTPEILDPERD